MAETSLLKEAIKYALKLKLNPNGHGLPKVLVDMFTTLADEVVRLTAWHPMSTAPREDEIPVLLLTKTYGQVEAWFSKGEWSVDWEGNRDYSGDYWICADDQFQIEVETLPDGTYDDGAAIRWRPLLDPPDLIGI